MGVNSAFTNLGVRERQSTYTPMPFEQMYAAMESRQKRYDTADAFDREEKKKISALSSPIAEHNDFLNEYKSKYLKDVTALHNNIPDKGSSEYIRKIQDVVDTYAGDANHKIVVDSNAAYANYITEKSKKLNDNKYAAHRDFYKGFKGRDVNGALVKFNYAGFSDALDVDKILHESIMETPEEKGKSMYFDPVRNQKVTIEEQGKRAEKIYNTMLSKLGNDGFKDWMDQKGLANPKEAMLHLQNYAGSVSNYAKNVLRENDFSAAKFQLDLAKHNLENQPPPIAEAMPMGRYEDNQLKELKSSVDEYTNPDGSVKDATGIGGQILDFGMKLAGVDSKDSKASRLKESRRALEEKIGPEIIKNFLVAARGDKDAALKLAINHIKNAGSGWELQGATIDDPKVRANIANDIATSNKKLAYYDPETMTTTNVEVADSKGLKDIVVGRELAPNTLSKTVDPATGYTTYNKTFMATVGNQNIIVAVPTNNLNDVQDQEIFNLVRFAKPVTLPRFVPNEITKIKYPQLGTKPLTNVTLVLDAQGQPQIAEEEDKFYWSSDAEKIRQKSKKAASKNTGIPQL